MLLSYSFKALVVLKYSLILLFLIGNY